MKKLLIITYYWPPAGGPGIQRVLKFAKYLPQFGWEPIILTVEDGSFQVLDESLLGEVDPALKVYKVKSFEPFNLYKKFIGKKKDYKIPTYVDNSKGIKWTERLSNWIRFNLFIPDARVGWKYKAIPKSFGNNRKRRN